MIDIKETISSEKLFDGHYKLMRQLNDRKASIAVWLARDVNTIDQNASANDESSGKLVSLMICHPSATLDIEDEQRWQDEFDAAYGCHHPNLLPPEEYAICNDDYYLVFPYSETESLRQFVGKNISDRVTWKLISSVASGLNELHTHQPQIVHGDIKPSNILVIDNEDFVLTHYGIHFETDLQRIDNHSDSMAYMAPERFQGVSKPCPESDIWAFGATLYEVLSGTKPFGEEGGKNQQDDTPMPPLQDQSPEIRDLVYACLQADPKNRPTAKQIKEATRSKKLSNKSKKKNQPKQAQAPSDKEKQHKKWPIAIAVASLLLIGVLVCVLIVRRHNNDPKDTDKGEVVAVNYYEKAERLLSDKNTAATGRELLDSLVSANDWQATFLLSRLYFDTREYDTVFYDKHWEMMRVNCDIVPDNGLAHEYLFDAFELNENDFMILYQLGCDFMAGDIRGCKRNLNFARWCFISAENTLNTSNPNKVRYSDALELVNERIPTSYSPSKPSR